LAFLVGHCDDLVRGIVEKRREKKGGRKEEVLIDGKVEKWMD